ncbi:MAG TPA: c-type cytochrome [Planctomycetaceae bacterium]|nr:c-type cytochrome [Planctomycetaceae bacterium]
MTFSQFRARTLRPRWPLWLAAGAGAVVIGVAGCTRAPEPEFVSSDAVKKLSPELQSRVVAILDENCGTAAGPKMLGDQKMESEHVKAGQALYMENCVRCHGVTGDGNGPVAKFMRPRPRDYRKGIFKFTTRPYGSRPRRADLLRTVRRGIPGTSMPSFRLLPDADIEALVDYVLVLTHRGELESELAIEADSSNEIAAGFPAEATASVLQRWKTAESGEVQALTPMPVFGVENVKRGRQAFLTKGCSKCHGEDGRGQTRDNNFVDSWGFQTRAADLTSGLLHGGPEPIDVYRRVHSGINGTPMPGFASALSKEPETIWDLVSYVFYVSNRRREKEIPPAGPIPQPVTASANGGAATSAKSGS